MTHFLLSTLASAVLGGAAPADEGLQWMTDVSLAKQKAADEGKDLFIDFTGSDWCGWCTKLDDEVLSKPEFVAKASEHFVFVYLDFPRSEEAKAKVVDAELNDKLMKGYGVGGFPTIVLASADGQPYGKTGYQAGGPTPYLESLAKLKEEGGKVKALIGADEPTEEQFLAAFPVMAEHELFAYPAYKPMMAQAKEMDPDGKKGLLKTVLKVEQNAAFQTMMEGLMEAGGDPDMDVLADFLLKHEHVSGQMFVGPAFAVAQHLQAAGKLEGAVKLFERIKAEPMLQGNADAQKMIGDSIDAAKKAMAEGASKDGEHAEKGEHEHGEGEEHGEKGEGGGGR